MKTVGYICRQCGEKFEVEILEEGEAEAKKIRATPVRCQKCKSGDIQQR